MLPFSLGLSHQALQSSQLCELAKQAKGTRCEASLTPQVWLRPDEDRAQDRSFRVLCSGHSSFHCGGTSATNTFASMGGVTRQHMPRWRNEY